MQMPDVPAGSGKHPIIMVAISANEMSESKTFYASLFNWQLMPISADITAAVTAGGPTISLRSNMPAGFQGTVPFIHVPDLDGALERAVATGGGIERAPWSVPMVGKLARFTDPSGTIYGLTSAFPPGEVPRIPAPFGDNPKPPVGTICSLEMYGRETAATEQYFRELFGWGTIETMPQYAAFDPGAGVGGVFQSHTPSMPAMPYIYVDNVSATLTAIEANGGKSAGQPMSMPGMGTFGYFVDPSGTHIGLIGP